MTQFSKNLLVAASVKMNQNYGGYINLNGMCKDLQVLFTAAH